MKKTNQWTGARNFIHETPKFQRYKTVKGKQIRSPLTKSEEQEEFDYWKIKNSSVRDSNVYVFWFEFLKRSEKYKQVCDSNGKSGSASLKKLYQDFGNVHKQTFRQWWRENNRGAYLFAEQTPEHKVREITSSEELFIGEEFLNIQIPLSFSQRVINRLVANLVKQKHSGSRGKIRTDKDSSALYKVTGRVNYKSLQKALGVYDLIEREKLKSKTDRMPYWEIANELNTNAFNNIKVTKEKHMFSREEFESYKINKRERKLEYDRKLATFKKSEYNLIKNFKQEFKRSSKEHAKDHDAKRLILDPIMSRLYRHAKKLIENAESGKFPNMGK